MKISLSLLSVGMIAAAAAAAGGTDFNTMDYTGNGLMRGGKLASRSEHAVTLFSTDFNSYTTAVVCTDTTGASAGQDGWSQFQSTPTGTNVFNAWTIVATTVGKELKNSWGSTTATGTTSAFLYQDNGGAGYTADTAGHDIEINFDLRRFANTNSNNKGRTQIRTYDATGTQTTIGFYFDNYATGTQNSITGLAYLNTGVAATTGTYGFGLAQASDTTSMGVNHSYYCAYDNDTGVVFWGWDVGLGTETNYYFDPFDSGYFAASNQAAISEFDWLGTRNSSTAVGNMRVDNIGYYASHDIIPAPGAAALIGLAGFASRRRRA